MKQVCCSLMFLFVWSASGLRLVSYHMPSVVDFRKELELSCEFDTEGEPLHSIKWFVNNTEFFRYSPTVRPEKTFHYVEGISIQVHRCNRTSVVLGPLYFTTSGEFKCVAQTAPPLYRTLAISKKLTVIALPKGGPTLEGIHPSHIWGDDLHLNCTSSPSYPAAEIFWTVADVPVPFHSIINYPSEREDEVRIRSTKSGVMLKTDELPFGADGEITVSCISSVPGIYRNSANLRLAKARRS